MEKKFMNIIDITGQRFGRLTAIRHAKERKEGQTMWECECDCGNIITTRSDLLRRGATKSCGCLSFVDFTGEKIGKLTVLKQAGRNKRNEILWACRCDCGNVVSYPSFHLKMKLKGEMNCGCTPTLKGVYEFKPKACERCGKQIKPNSSKQKYCKICAPEATKERTIKNREWLKEYHHHYYRKKRKDPSWKLNEYKDGASKRGLNWELSDDYAVTLFYGDCYWCGDRSNNSRLNGIDRIDNKEGYTVKNAVSCCKYCNWLKGGYDEHVFLTQCIKIATHHSNTFYNTQEST